MLLHHHDAAILHAAFSFLFWQTLVCFKSNTSFIYFTPPRNQVLFIEPIATTSVYNHKTVTLYLGVVYRTNSPSKQIRATTSVYNHA